MAQRRRPRVLVTRTRDQSSILAEQLLRVDLEPVLLPLLEIIPPTSFSALDAALHSLPDFDWLIFTSANAVACLVRRAAELGVALTLAPRQRIAAIGPATAAALKRYSLTPDLLPSQSVAEGLAAALLPYACRADGAPARLLLPCAEQAREILASALSAAGAEVTSAPAYRSVLPAGAHRTLRETLAGPDETALDAVTFTSSSTAENLFSLLNGSGLVLPDTVLRASIGPITSETLRRLGYPPHIEAQHPATAALALAVAEALSERRFVAPTDAFDPA